MTVVSKKVVIKYFLHSYFREREGQINLGLKLNPETIPLEEIMINKQSTNINQQNKLDKVQIRHYKDILQGKNDFLSCLTVTVYLVYFLSFSWLCHVTSGILVLQPGTETGSHGVEAQSLNHGATREFPTVYFLFKYFFLFFGCMGHGILVAQ